MSEPAICCRGVGKVWAAGTERAHEALRGIDLTVEDGEFVVSEVTNITAKMLSGIYAPVTIEGSLLVNGVLVSSYTTFKQEALQAMLLDAAFNIGRFIGYGSLFETNPAEQREIPHPHRIQDAIQVVVFVLDDVGVEPGRLALRHHPVAVHAAVADARRPRYRGAQPRDRQAALPAQHPLIAQQLDLRVDQHGAADRLIERMTFRLSRTRRAR